MMRDLTGNVRVAVAGYCPGMERYTDEQLETFLAEEGLGKLLLAYAAEHPAHVKPYSKEYRFLNVK